MPGRSGLGRRSFIGNPSWPWGCGAAGHGRPSPGMVEGLGASICAKEGPPESTRMNHHHLWAWQRLLWGISILCEGIVCLEGIQGLNSNLSSELAPHPVLSADWEFKTSHLTFLFGSSLRFIGLRRGRRNVLTEFLSWAPAWDLCVVTRMTIQVPHFAIFFEDYRKRDPVGNSLSPGRDDSVRWSQELFWILQVLLHIPHPDSPMSCPDLVLLPLWAQQMALTAAPPWPSCFCHTQ